MDDEPLVLTTREWVVCCESRIGLTPATIEERFREQIKGEAALAMLEFVLLMAMLSNIRTPKCDGPLPA